MLRIGNDDTSTSLILTHFAIFLDYEMFFYLIIYQKHVISAYVVHLGKAEKLYNGMACFECQWALYSTFSSTVLHFNSDKVGDQWRRHVNITLVYNHVKHLISSQGRPVGYEA